MHTMHFNHCPLTVIEEELRYRILKQLQDNPSINQRELAKQLGISLGKVNYCLRAVIDKGWVKARNFKNSNNKLAYAYYLTPMGIEEKTRVTLQFLKIQLQQFRVLEEEIASLRREIQQSDAADGSVL